MEPLEEVGCWWQRLMFYNLPASCSFSPPWLGMKCDKPLPVAHTFPTKVRCVPSNYKPDYCFLSQVASSQIVVTELRKVTDTWFIIYVLYLVQLLGNQAVENFLIVKNPEVSVAYVFFFNFKLLSRLLIFHVHTLFPILLQVLCGVVFIYFQCLASVCFQFLFCLF